MVDTENLRISSFRLYSTHVEQVADEEREGHDEGHLYVWNVCAVVEMKEAPQETKYQIHWKLSRVNLVEQRCALPSARVCIGSEKLHVVLKIDDVLVINGLSC